MRRLVLIALCFFLGFPETTFANTCDDPKRVKLRSNCGVVLWTGINEPMAARVELLNERREPIATVLTDKEGIFRFEGVKSGKYLLRTSAVSGDSDMFVMPVEFTKRLSSECEIVFMISPKTNMACMSGAYKSKKDFKKYAREPRI